MLLMVEYPMPTGVGSYGDIGGGVPRAEGEEGGCDKDLQRRCTHYIGLTYNILKHCVIIRVF
jgi:hypothetical protein